MKRKRPDEQKVLTLRLQQEQEELEKNMTLRRDKKKESITKKLLEHERYKLRFSFGVFFFINNAKVYAREESPRWIIIRVRRRRNEEIKNGN